MAWTEPARFGNSERFIKALTQSNTRHNLEVNDLQNWGGILYLDEQKKYNFWTYEDDEKYWARKSSEQLFLLPFKLVSHALDKKKIESEPGPGTFCWKGKHYNIEEYIQLCAQEIYAEGYDLEYLHKLLDDIIDVPGHDLNEYRIEALKKVIARTEADLAAQEKQEDE